MADLFEKDDLPGAGPFLGDLPAENRVLPPLDLAQAAPPEQALGMVGEAAPAAHAPRQTKVVKPQYEPREPHENRVLSGNPEAPPDRADLNPTQRLVADYKLANPEATQAQISDKLGISQTHVSRSLLRPQVKLYMSAILNAAGATLQKAARVVSEAQDAKVVSYFSFEGKVCDERVDIDHDIRLKAAKVSMEAHGVLEDKGMQVNVYQSMTDEQLVAIRAGQARPEDFIEGQTA